jgi:hypothetical protein
MGLEAVHKFLSLQTVVSEISTGEEPATLLE